MQLSRESDGDDVNDVNGDDNREGEEDGNGEGEGDGNGEGEGDGNRDDEGSGDSDEDDDIAVNCKGRGKAKEGSGNTSTTGSKRTMPQVVRKSKRIRQ